MRHFWYLASPYSKYARGIEAAAGDVAIVAGKLAKMGVKFFSPICHTHIIAMAGGIDPLAHDFWMTFDKPMIAKCDGLMVVMMHGWEESIGVKMEIADFRSTERPVCYIDPYSAGWLTSREAA